MPRFNTGLAKYSKLIIEMKTSSSQVKALRANVMEMRSEEARECKLKNFMKLLKCYRMSKSSI